MADIIKTWPAFMDAKKVAQIFAPKGCFARYYFTLGRGKPKQPITRIWFTWRGRILGSFAIDVVVCNDGSLPRLSRIDGEPSEWQIRKDAWVAVCAPGCERLKERVFMSGFRGWHYFDLETYRSNPESRIRV
jgi:hypothetical protein